MHRSHSSDRRRGFCTCGAVLLVICLAALLSIGETAPAEPAGAKATEEIAARVNGDPITVPELNRIFLAHVKVPYSTVQADPRAQEIRRQLLDTLIDRALLVQQAKKQRMTVPPQALEEAVQVLIQRFPARESFEEALQAEGLTFEGITQDLGDQLLRKQLVQNEIVEKISLNPNDIPGFYEQHQSRYMAQEQVRARHILIKVPPDMGEADEAKLRDRANTLRLSHHQSRGTHVGKTAPVRGSERAGAGGFDARAYSRTLSGVHGGIARQSDYRGFIPLSL